MERTDNPLVGDSDGLNLTVQIADSQNRIIFNVLCIDLVDPFVSTIDVGQLSLQDEPVQMLHPVHGQGGVQLSFISGHVGQGGLAVGGLLQDGPAPLVFGNVAYTALNTVNAYPSPSAVCTRSKASPDAWDNTPAASPSAPSVVLSQYSLARFSFWR